MKLTLLDKAMEFFDKMEKNILDLIINSNKFVEHYNKYVSEESIDFTQVNMQGLDALSQNMSRFMNDINHTLVGNSKVLLHANKKNLEGLLDSMKKRREKVAE